MKGTICGTIYNLFIIIVKCIFCETKKMNLLVSPLGSRASPSAEREARGFNLRRF